MSRRLPSSETFLWVSGLAFVYASLSFLWSALGFLSPVPPIHLHEYAFPALVTEVGGHVLFGLLAALPTMDIGLVLLAGGESVLIDSDHLLAALGYPVEGRLAHSAFFAIFAALVLAYLARRSGRGGRGVFFVTLSSVAAHLSYDVFAGNGFFYIAAPLSFASYEFPLWTWLPLLLIGVALSSFGRIRMRRRASGTPTSDKSAPPAGPKILTPVK